MGSPSGDVPARRVGVKKTFFAFLLSLMASTAFAADLPTKTEQHDFLEKAAQEKGAITTSTGLIYRSLKEGTGQAPGPFATVTANYRGTLVNGKEFDSSYKAGKPLEFRVYQVIPCWKEGLQRMRAGGKAQLVCPPEVGYGEEGAGSDVPPNAVLVFEVELLRVKQ
jgi:FKBP-type peptidyl-prolyl cis-trans isomerase FkpA